MWSNRTTTSRKGKFALAEFAANLYQVHLGRGPRRVHGPGRVLPAHLPDRRPAPTADAGRSTHHARGWRARRRPADQLRWREDALDDRALPPVLRAAGDGFPAGGPGSPRRPLASRNCPACAVRSWSAPRCRPGQPEVKPDGTEVRTLWGEIAWQLGGADGYQLVAEADRTATSPGQAHVRGVPALRAVPGPDRRVGRLRPAALRDVRAAARRHVRDAVLVRADPGRRSDRGSRCAARGVAAGVG